MARRSSKDDAPADFDDLLSEEVVDEVIEEPAEEDLAEEAETEPRSDVPDRKGMTPGEQRIADLKAKLRQVQSITPEPEPEEDDGLSDEERAQIKLLEDELAKTSAKAIADAPVRYDNSQRGGTGEKILFHITLDGFTAFGDVWLRGQEIEIEVGTPAWNRTLDEFGTSWVTLRDNVQAQYDRWGKQYIAEGPFIARPNEKFDDSVADSDRRRGRSVPITTV